MKRFTRITLLLGFAVLLTPFVLRALEKPKRMTLEGKVVPISDLVGKIGSRLDPDAKPLWLALVTKEGKIYPLIKESGSRMFFRDKRLLNVPVRLTARALPGSQLIQVLDMHQVKNGKLHEVFYWCDVCSIRRLEKNLCECCGGPMDLYIEPVKQK